MVKVAFFKGGFYPSDVVIRLWTLGLYSHCEFLIDDVMYGAKQHEGTRAITRHTVDTRWWDYLDVPMSSAEKERLKAWCISELGCDYDWRGLVLSQVIGLRREDPEKWFCSEYCTAGLQHIGRLPGVKPCCVSPNRLSRLMRGSRFSFV